MRSSLSTVCVTVPKLYTEVNHLHYNYVSDEVFIYWIPLVGDCMKFTDCKYMYNVQIHAHTMKW